MGCGFLTETDEANWRDCAYASWLMALNDAGVKLPLGLTKAEREALERSDDRPDEQGASHADLITGTHRRYGLDYTEWTGSSAAFLARLGDDDSAAVAILYGSLPVHYQRWDPHFAAQGFNSRHEINLARRSSVDGSRKAGSLWLRDPLGRGTYCGEWIAEADVMRAAAAYGGGTVHALIAAPLDPPDTSTEEDVVITAMKGEDWKAVKGNGAFRARPERTAPIADRVIDGTIVRSILEAETPDGTKWRGTIRAGAPAWFIHYAPDLGYGHDFVPLKQGGDAAVAAGLADYVARKVVAIQTVTVTGQAMTVAGPK